MAAMAALMIGISSVWFAYSTVEYGEEIVATLILAMYLLVDDRPWLAGLLGGYAVAVRMDAIIWVALTGLIGSSNRKKSWRPIALGAVPGLLLMAVSNYARTGSPLSSGYEHRFSSSILVGLYGLLFSAGKSLFLFSPLMVLYAAAARKLWRECARRRFVVWTLGLLVAQLLFYARWWDWSGEDAWGAALFGDCHGGLSCGLGGIGLCGLAMVRGAGDAWRPNRVARRSARPAHFADARPPTAYYEDRCDYEFCIADHVRRYADQSELLAGLRHLGTAALQAARRKA